MQDLEDVIKISYLSFINWENVSVSPSNASVSKKIFSSLRFVISPERSNVKEQILEILSLICLSK